MRKNLFIIILLCACSAYAHTQPRWKFRSAGYTGLLQGQSAGYGQVQTVNGIYKGPWFLGIGAGIDWYRLRSVPVFVSATRDLLRGKNNALFLGLDAGWDLPWYKSPPSPSNDFLIVTPHGAPYWGANMGYKIGISGHSGGLLLTAGYSFKALKEDHTTGIHSCPVGFYCGGPVQTLYYNYHFNRLLLKIGWLF